MRGISQKDLDEFEMDMLRHLYYGFSKPSNNEYEIMQLVSSTLEKTKQNNKINYIDTDEAIKEGLLSLRVFNRKYIDRLKKVEFYTSDDVTENDFTTLISFRKKRGKINQIIIPEKTNELSPIWIGHECIHCLKDINYKEYKDKDLYSEVLTIFYEILVSHTIFNDIHDIWKNERNNMLISNNNYYNLLKNNLNDKEKENVYEFAMYLYGEYLTNYYYALNLFHLYKKNPELITKYINKVLNRRMTTFDLLNKFDIYKINQEHVNIYKFEHSNL